MKRFLPHVSVTVATFGWRWLPKFKHSPAVYYRARGNGYDLANDGDRMSVAATRFMWGPITMVLIWP